MPESSSVPPAATREDSVGCSCTSVRARMFATTSLYSSGASSAGSTATNRSAIPLSAALARETLSAYGSISTPTARRQPKSSAAKATTPEPEPKSSIASQPVSRPPASSECTPRTQSCVVACSPVPNAIPGCSCRAGGSAPPEPSPALSACHGKRMRRQPASSTGAQSNCTCDTQSRAPSSSTSKRGGVSPATAAARRRVASTSTSGAKPTSSCVLDQTGVRCPGVVSAGSRSSSCALDSPGGWAWYIGCSASVPRPPSLRLT
mmetsp:Transcript_32928/g.105833  ORF Transcript_32928/g.105833 Transcript_32928/m.105833 type:complete len:263 (+) Transcript_32928:711-1499(+)